MCFYIVNTPVAVAHEAKSFAALLKAKRLEKDLSMAAFGALVARSAASIHAYENGDLPTGPVLPFFAKALEISLDELTALVAADQAARSDLARVDQPAAAPSAREA